MALISENTHNNGKGWGKRRQKGGKKDAGAHHQHDNTPPDATVVIPYVNRTSEAIRRVLTPLSIRTCFKPQTTLKNILTHVKDPVPPEEKTGVVYKVPCSDCQATYVGQTGRTLLHRIKEHKRALPHEFCTCRTCHGHWA